jgi:menaquinone-specific isochorismate synthase
VQSALVVRSVAIPAEVAADLIALLPAEAPLSWVRRGEGLVGWGAAVSLRTTGPTRFADAAKWWAELAARSAVTDDVGEPGTGLVAFGSFAFSDDDASVDSVLIVPSVVVGRRGDVAWVTTVGTPDAEMPSPRLTRTPPPARPTGVTFADGALDGEQWMSAVAEAVSRIEAGALEKVVLARDLIATAEQPVDVRWPLSQLASSYPMCWTFHVDGIFGATPELLVRRERGLVTSRVLAGTIRRTGDETRDAELAGALSRSSKDLEEHEYAVRSVADALEPHCSSMNVPEAPFVLHLPNVMHLATDVTGVVHDGITSLELAAALHPSAAVGGTPRDRAVAMIAELERMSRDRYAAPVGWMDAAGDGEWGIALRSALISGDTVRLLAGCGVVGSSDPASELAESQAKLVPVRDVLGG